MKVPADMFYDEWYKKYVSNNIALKSGKNKIVANHSDNAIIKPTDDKEVKDVHYIGKIDKDIYKCVTNDITTDEVIITDERISHIKDHHPGHFELIEPFLQTAIDSPDYILKDAKNTGLILKQITENDLRIQMVLRIHTSADTAGFKNSIISAWKISESRWENYINNKEILYKSE